MSPLHHDRVFDRFWPVVPRLQEGLLEDSFLGTVFRSTYDVIRVSRGAAAAFPPPVNEEYFEWIDLLSAVVQASDDFTFLELGAGYGRWSIRAAAAARQRGIETVTLGCVEAEPTHFEWLRQTLFDNGLARPRCTPASPRRGVR